ncbi:MAG: PmoA family protein [Bacteroidales bacterium]|jgi:hypothetical protein|nr:PmoA family protein [Bacteroidales bacterium]
MKQTFFTVIVISALTFVSACTPKPVAIMTAEVNPDNGQYVICESGKPVLQYNYQTVYEEDVVRSESQKAKKIAYYPISGVYLDEYYKSNPAVGRDGKATSAIWAIPRSNYIHPLYGLDGEMLTNDWPDADHPHHRGIFWAWPEVEYGSQRGDLYALQRVFARPSGNVKCSGGPEYAEIEAENRWIWEEKKAIAREWATIRAYRASEGRRIIDLTVRIQAVTDSITVATRFTNSYGGLNVRMATPQNQNIAHFADTATASTVRCRADFSGIFESSQSTSGMTILQHKENPEYPGKWVEYPSLSWIQPTFPTPNTRYPLSKDKQLVLRYRFIVHQGGKPDDAVLSKQWDDYHSVKN